MSTAGTVTVRGSLLAFTSGAFISFGFALINDEVRDLESLRKTGVRKVLGGGLFVLGIYIFSPAFLREAWSANFYS